VSRNESKLRIVRVYGTLTYSCQDESGNHREPSETPLKAVRFHTFGGPDVLVYEEVKEPKVGRDDVLVSVKAASLNHLDIDVRSGVSRLPIQLPHTLGMELAGDLVDVGSATEGVAVGDRVAPLYASTCHACEACRAGNESLCSFPRLLGIHVNGGYADLVVVPARDVIPLPRELSYVDAAAIQTSFGTALHALRTRVNLQPGETVLISAAGSGVGSAAIQVALMLGARVIVSAGDDSKLDRATSLGAMAGVNYRAEDIATAVLAWTDGRGVDVVLEHVGGAVFGDSLRALAPGGRIAVVGGHAGEIVPLDLIALFRAEWSVVGARRASNAELREAVALVGQGTLRSVIAETVALEDAADAHRLAETHSVFGKIVLEP
jgi:NADPH:quinone reductase-like Zn-dependent oxidoreductase